MDKDLISLRAQIDQVDQRLLDLLSRRLQMAEQVAKAKPKGAPIFRPDRESQLLARLCAAADPQLSQVINAVWRAIISASIARQQPEFSILMTTESERTARLFAAGQLTVKQTDSPLDLCNQLATGSGDIGIVEVDELKATVGWLHEKVMRVESRIIELDEDHLECTRSSKSVNVYEDNAAE